MISVSQSLLCVIIQADQSPKNPHMPLRHTDALVEPISDLLFLPVCLSLSYLLFILFFFFLVTLCLPIFFPYVSLPSSAASIRMPSSLTARVAILCHFCFIFTPCVPFSLLQSNPFTLSSNSLGHPRVLSLFFHLSISFSLLLSVSSSLSLPLCSAHLHHIKIPLFFLQRIVQSLRDLLHSSMFSLPLSLHICLPLFLSILAELHSVRFSFSFVFLTHLYPSLSPSVFSYSIPPCRFNKTY